MILNWPLAILTFVVLFSAGIVSVCSPITIARLIMRNPNPEAFPEELLSPKVREALRLIKNDPERYARRFSEQIDFIRLSGAVALFMAVVLLAGIWHDLSR